MTDSTNPSIASRAVVTAIALCCVYAFDFIPVPGVDFAGAGAKLGMEVAALAVTTAGLGGFIVGSLLVALVGSVTPVARSTAWRASTVLALIFAGFHAHGLSLFIFSDGTYGLTTGAYSYPTLVATIVAGVCVLIALAQWIERRGLGSGIVIVALLPHSMAR